MMTTEEWNDKPTGNAAVVQLYTETELQAAIAAEMMRADARVAACLEDAASNVSNEVTPSWAADLIAKNIRSRTPADALAALEAVKAAVRADIAAWLDTLPNDTTPAGAAILLRKGGA